MKQKLVGYLLLVSILTTLLNASHGWTQDKISYASSRSISEETDPLEFPMIKDKRILNAMSKLQNTDGEWARKAIAGYNITNKPIKVVFKNLTSISPEFKDLDALGWSNEDHSLTIYINQKHINAPPEALAALLCHESIHQDRKNSISEEVYGSAIEAEVWIQLKEKFPQLKTLSPGLYPLVDRENLMEMLYRQAGFKSQLIDQKIRENVNYKTLPETSPGFGS